MNNRLRSLRLQRDWTQAELARRLEVSRQTVHSLETGRFHPSLPVALRISRLFGEPVEAIFTVERPASPP